MDPEREAKYADYLLSDGQRRLLLSDSSLGKKDTNKAKEIRSRAGNLDLRIQYLLEDIVLFNHSGVFDSIDMIDIKDNLEDIDPYICNRGDSLILESQMEDSAGINASPFGLAIGHALSLIYPANPTEQQRLWWGLVLGYFGSGKQVFPQPYTNINVFDKMLNSDSDELAGDFLSGSEMTRLRESPAQNVLETVSRKINDLDKKDTSLLQRAERLAESLVNSFGDVLELRFTPDNDLDDVTDLPVIIQTGIAATKWGRLDEQNRIDAYYHFLKHLKEEQKNAKPEPSIVEEIFSEASSTSVENGTRTYVDLELLKQIHKLYSCLKRDKYTLLGYEGHGIVAADVFEFLWHVDEPQYASEVNSEIQKGVNNVKWMLNEFANQSEDHKGIEWFYSPPVNETANGFELNQYGELLGYSLTNSNLTNSGFYALAFNEKFRCAFDIEEQIPALVDIFVENDVPFDGGT